MSPRALLPSALLQHLVQPHPRLLQEQERCVGKRPQRDRGERGWDAKIMS